MISQDFSEPFSDWRKSLMIKRRKMMLRGMKLPRTTAWESWKVLLNNIYSKLFSNHSYFTESQRVEFTCPRSLGCKVKLPLKASCFERKGYTQNRTNFNSQLSMSSISETRKLKGEHSEPRWDLSCPLLRVNLLQGHVTIFTIALIQLPISPLALESAWAFTVALVLSIH